MIAALLAACVTPTPTTPVGPLGASGPLPLPGSAGARPSTLDEYRVKAEICAWPEVGLPPAEVEVTVRSFAVGADRHLAEYEVAVTRSAPDLEIRLKPAGAPGGASLEPGAPWMGVADLAFACHRSTRAGCRSATQQGAALVQVRADGSLH